MSRVAGDIDIDFANRKAALEPLEHISASRIQSNKIEKHNTGVYFHAVPIDPLTGYSSIDYESAEDRGFYKMDLLNVHVYDMVKDETHLLDLMNRDFDWKLLEYPEFSSQLIHLGNHSELVSKLKPKSIDEISMVLALIRPGKRHLVSQCISNGFDSIKDEIWKESTDGSFSFRRSHSISYAVLVKVHAGLLIEQISV